MKEINQGTYTGERALYDSHDMKINGAIFEDGESPLKESSNLIINQSTFRWKYPLWYCENIICENVILQDTARSGIWYTRNITMNNCDISAPKTFRRSEWINLTNCQLPNALETFWSCKNIKLKQVSAHGDYMFMNVEGVEVDQLNLVGNYAFDGGKNIIVRSSRLESKDAFWNCENVTVIDSTIVGEYLAWNSKNITFINCSIESHQGLCYSDNVKLVNCKLINTDLCFEFCRNVDADINSEIVSVKNPYSGVIHAQKIGELIMDEKYIDPKMTKIIVK